MAKRSRSTFERLQRGERLSRRERRLIERQLQADDPGWEIVHRTVAGIDVGNESHFVAVDPRQTDQPVREFGSWTDGRRQMVAWLKTCQVQRVVLQTTAVYWIPVQDVLEKAGFEVAVVDARGTKNLPGRKSDVQECQPDREFRRCVERYRGDIRLRGFSCWDQVDTEVGYLWLAAELGTDGK
jgi:Transposase